MDWTKLFVYEKGLQKLVRILPFMTLVYAVLNANIRDYSKGFPLSYYHYQAMALVLANLTLYIFHFKSGIVFTLFLIFLGMFNVVHFSFIIQEASFWLGNQNGNKITSPTVDARLFLVLLLYLILNLRLLWRIYLDAEEWLEERI